jgi:hypothetical protein
MGKVDVERMLEGMREQLERDQADGKLAGLTVERLADTMSRPGAPEVVAEVMEADARSVKQGERAPDFSLSWLPGSGEGRAPRMTLSEHFGVRPVALIFGSYT